jgi:hypothetical protein
MPLKENMMMALIKTVSIALLLITMAFLTLSCGGSGDGSGERAGEVSSTLIPSGVGT